MKLKGLGNRLYNIFFHTHTVAGITISAGLYVIFLSGAFSLFRYEMYQWENVTARGKEIQDIAIAPTIAALEEAVPGLLKTDRITIIPSTKEEPIPHVYGYKSDTDTTKARFIATVDPTNNYSLDLHHEHSTTIGETLYELHFFGQIPFVGLQLSGFVALFFLFASVTGVMIHWRNIVSKFYAFSVRSKWKQIWTNAHTVLGMIGLPFQIIYAVTGAFYGLLIFLILPSALILFQGDQEAVSAAVRPADAIEYSESARPADFSHIDRLLADAKSRYPELEARFIHLQNYGLEDGTLSVYLVNLETLNGRVELIYRVPSEEILFEAGPGKPNYTSDIVSVMGKLHFATFGGLGLKVMYFILSLLTCFMLISGMLLWQAARDKKSYTDKQKRFHHRVTKVNLAICLGLFPAIALLFIANKLVPMDLDGRIFYVNTAFFGGWLLLIIAGLLWDNYRRINRNYLLIGGVLSLLIPLLNGLVTGHWIWVSLRNGWDSVAWVDLVWLAFGIVSLAVASKVKNQPASSAKSTSRTTTPSKVRIKETA